MVQQRKRTDSYQLESPNIGANCPQTSGTVPKLAALSPSPQRGSDLSPKARARVLTEYIISVQIIYRKSGNFHVKYLHVLFFRCVYYYIYFLNHP